MDMKFVFLSSEILMKDKDITVKQKRLFSILKVMLTEGALKPIILNTSGEDSEDLPSLIATRIKYTGGDIDRVLEITNKIEGNEYILMSMHAVNSNSVKDLLMAYEYNDMFSGDTDTRALKQIQFYEIYVIPEMIKLFGNNKYKELVTKISKSGENISHQMDSYFLLLIAVHRMMGIPYRVEHDKRENGEYAFLFTTKKNKYLYVSSNIGGTLDLVISNSKSFDDYTGLNTDFPERNADELLAIIREVFKNDELVTNRIKGGVM